MSVYRITGVFVYDSIIRRDPLDLMFVHAHDRCLLCSLSATCMPAGVPYNHHIYSTINHEERERVHLVHPNSPALVIISYHLSVTSSECDLIRV